MTTGRRRMLSRVGHARNLDIPISRNILGNTIVHMSTIFYFNYIDVKIVERTPGLAVNPLWRFLHFTQTVSG